MSPNCHANGRPIVTVLAISSIYATCRNSDGGGISATTSFPVAGRKCLRKTVHDALQNYDAKTTSMLSSVALSASTL